MRLPAFLIAAFLTFAGMSAGQAADAAPKIAVLRLEEVLRKSKSYADGMEGWKKQQAEAQALIAGIDEQLKQLEGQLQVIKSDNENYAKFQEQFEVLKLKKKISYERARGELERHQVALVKEAYRQVHASLQSFAQERGIMLVHLAPDPDLGAPTFNEVQLELGLKSVLFYDPSLDITDAFIQFLNAGGGKSGEPAAKPTESAVKPTDAGKPLTP
jgi:Skp family chaperone for outer membrane proteins